MEIKDFLNKGDVFAARAGVQLTEVNEGYARAEMVVTEAHLNAGGVCQGGAIFTLADLALAAVLNVHGTLTYGLQNNIVFLHSAKFGDRLIAEAVETYNHHKIPYAEVEVRNQRNELISVFTGIAYRTRENVCEPVSCAAKADADSNTSATKA